MVWLSVCGALVKTSVRNWTQPPLGNSHRPKGFNSCELGYPHALDKLLTVTTLVATACSAFPSETSRLLGKVVLLRLFERAPLSPGVLNLSSLSNTTYRMSLE
jgi:hypothetical protein